MSLAFFLKLIIILFGKELKLMNNDKVYIFLDIDGVLNAPGDKIILEMFEESKLKIFTNFALSYNAIIVITSSRRFYSNDVKIINEVFGEHFKIILLNEKKTSKYRGKEIEYFILANNISRYVIFDDVDNHISDVEKLNKHFVLVNYLTGLTNLDLAKAKQIL